MFFNHYKHGLEQKRRLAQIPTLLSFIGCTACKTMVHIIITAFTPVVDHVYFESFSLLKDDVLMQKFEQKYS